MLRFRRLHRGLETLAIRTHYSHLPVAYAVARSQDVSVGDYDPWLSQRKSRRRWFAVWPQNRNNARHEIVNGGGAWFNLFSTAGFGRFNSTSNYRLNVFGSCKGRLSVTERRDQRGKDVLKSHFLTDY